MALRHVLDDGQTEAGAASFTRTAAVHTIKAFRQTAQVLGRNARTRIGHRKYQTTICPWPDTDRDAPVGRCVANRVADQVTHGTEQFTGRTSQKAIKVTVEYKLMVS